MSKMNLPVIPRNMKRFAGALMQVCLIKWACFVLK